MKYLYLHLLLAVTTAALLTPGGKTVADGHERLWEDDDHTHDQARRAVDRGEVLKIAEVMARLKTQVEGEVVGVEFERERGGWRYEFKLLDSHGRLIELEVDALTGRVLSVDEK